MMSHSILNAWSYSPCICINSINSIIIYTIFYIVFFKGYHAGIAMVSPEFHTLKIRAEYS